MYVVYIIFILIDSDGRHMCLLIFDKVYVISETHGVHSTKKITKKFYYENFIFGSWKSPKILILSFESLLI